MDAIGDKVNAYWNAPSNRRSLRKIRRKKKTNKRERKEEIFFGKTEKETQETIDRLRGEESSRYVRENENGEMEIASFFPCLFSFVFFLLRSRYDRTSFIFGIDIYIYIYFRNAVGHNARHY